MEKMTLFEKGILDEYAERMDRLTREEKDALKAYEYKEERVAWLNGYTMALDWARGIAPSTGVSKIPFVVIDKVLAFVLICCSLGIVGMVASMIISAVQCAP